MIVPTYQPGDWYAVITNGTIAVLPSATAPAVVAALWEAARSGEGLTSQLQVLLARPLAELPPFALVTVTSGRVHAVVRGDVALTVATDSGVRTVAAAEVSTWTEEVVDGARSVSVRVDPTSSPSPAGDPGLPVLSAVVRVAAVRLELGAGGGGDGADRANGAHGDAPAGVPLEQAETGPLRLVPEAVDTPDAAHGPAEDHDGLTVLSSDVVALRRQMPRWAGDEVPGPLVVPDAGTRPPAKILLSSGLVVSLNRPVLLGRAPQVSRVSNERLPRLVTVASPNQDISRTHAEVRQDGEDVLVTDLRSTNGVLLLRQNGTPQRLHPGEPTVVEPGVVVDLGEGVTFTVEHGT